jgi:hypothetical protein
VRLIGLLPCLCLLILGRLGLRKRVTVASARRCASRATGNSTLPRLGSSGRARPLACHGALVQRGIFRSC